MVVTSIGSYVMTADQIIAHGTDVNADRLANALPEWKLPGNYDLADLIADRNELEAKVTALVGLENLLEAAIDNRDAHRINIRDRLKQFRLALRLSLRDTTYYKRVPILPPLGAIETKFLREFDDMAEQWARIDADTSVAGFTPPLKLTGNYTRAGFVADLATMRAYFTAVTNAENDEDIARKDRDKMLGPLKERMLQYRAFIELEYGPGHPFTQSLPDVSPSNGGSSGEGVPAPSGLVLMLGPSQGVEAGWEPVEDADHYLVYVQRTEIDPDFVVEPTEFASNTASLGPFALGVVVRVKVSAVRNDVEGPQSDVATVTMTGAGGTAPATPGMPILTVQNTSEVFADWADVPGATGYRVFQQFGTNSEFVEVGPSSISQTTLSFLPPGETIRVRVTAFNSAGESQPGPYGEITMPEEP